MVLPRILDGLGREGLFAKAATRSTRAAPPISRSASRPRSRFVLALTGTFETVFRLMGTLVVFGMIISEASQFALALQRARPPRAPMRQGYPVLPLLVMAIDIALLAAVLWADPVSGAYMVMLVVVCVPIHFGSAGGRRSTPSV